MDEMHKVKILKNFEIAFDGNNISRLAKGSEIEVTDAQLERLVHYGVVELDTKVKPEVTKVVEPEIKEAPKKKKKK